MKNEPALSFSWGGNVARLTTKDRRLRDALAVIFGAFLETGQDHLGPDSPHESTLSAGLGEDEESFDSLGQAVLELEDAVAWRLLDGCEHLLLHSAAVTDGKRTILVLGMSGAGKTTMTLELVKRGFHFMADEYTVIDLAGALLHPFPRSTVVKNIVGDFPPGDSVSVETEFGSRLFYLPHDVAALEPVPIGEACLIFPRFEEGAATELKSVGAAELCTRLMLGAFNFEHNERELWPALSQLCAGARACEVCYGDVVSGLDEALGFFAA